MNCEILAFLAPLFLFAEPVAAADQPTGGSVPLAIEEEIERAYPNYTRMDHVSLNPAANADEALALRICPDFGHYSATADFDGNGAEDAALMLIEKSAVTADRPVTRVVIVPGLSRPRKAPAELTTLGPEYSARGWYVVAINEPTLYNFETNAWVDLKAPALGLIRCGGGSQYWFWNGKAYEYAGGM